MAGGSKSSVKVKVLKKARKSHVAERPKVVGAEVLHHHNTGIDRYLMYEAVESEAQRSSRGK